MSAPIWLIVLIIIIVVVFLIFVVYWSIRAHKRKIVGVVKNYHFRSLHKEIEPLVLIHSPEFCRILCVRIKPGAVPTIIKFFEKKWKRSCIGSACYWQQIVDCGLKKESTSSIYFFLCENFTQSVIPIFSAKFLTKRFLFSFVMSMRI